MNKEYPQILESIIKVLRDNKEGLDISQISKKINVYRATVSKYLLLLQNEGKVSSRKVGPAKIYYLTEGRVHHISSPKSENKDWVDEFIDELKEEMKKEILGT